MARLRIAIRRDGRGAAVTSDCERGARRSWHRVLERVDVEGPDGVRQVRRHRRADGSAGRTHWQHRRNARWCGGSADRRADFTRTRQAIRGRPRHFAGGGLCPRLSRRHGRDRDRTIACDVLSAASPRVPWIAASARVAPYNSPAIPGPRAACHARTRPRLTTLGSGYISLSALSQGERETYPDPDWARLVTAQL